MIIGETIEDYAKGLVERSSCKTQAEKDYYYTGALLGAMWEKKQMRAKAHQAFVELLRVQYGEDCDESMHQYIDDALRKHMEG